MRKHFTNCLPVALASITLLASLPAHAEKWYDLRVRTACEEQDLTYKKDGIGNYTVRIQWEWRFQEVTASSKTFKYVDQDMRTISTTGWRGNGKNVPEIAKQLLLSKQRMGYWRLVQKDEIWEAVYTINIPAECSSQDFYRAVFSVASEADSMEEDLMNTNQF